MQHSQKHIHHWENDKCIVCGLKRKLLYDPHKKCTRSKNGKYYKGAYRVSYLVNKKWVFERPLCLTKDGKKICLICKKPKALSEFGLHGAHKKRPKEKPFLKARCKKCEAEIAAKHREQIKDTPEYKERNRRNTQRYIESNLEEIHARRKLPNYKAKKRIWELRRYYRKKDEINARMKIKRQTPEYKAKMKAYRAKNKEKIYKQEVVTKKRYHEKHRDSVTDEYVIRQLVGQGVATREGLLENYALIEAKRLQILIKREINNHGKNTDNPD